MEALSELPPERQRVVADAFQSFTEMLVRGMRTLEQQNGEGYVIKEEDVQRMLQQAGLPRP